MRLQLSASQRRHFFKCAYPARSLLAMDKRIFSHVDHIIGYNSRAKIFNLFASVDPVHPLDGMVLCVTYDQDTDDLEIIAAAVEVAGRKLLYEGDYKECPGQVMENYDLYMKEPQEIAKEAQAITKKIELSENFQGEWK